MKLYLSSYRMPAPEAFADLVGKPLGQISMALIPNAKDYYADLAKTYKVNDLLKYFENLGISVTVVDLQGYQEASVLEAKLQKYDVVWAMGGNTFCLRYQMKRSGFEQIIKKLLTNGVVYAGDSAGALVAGTSIKGIESADIPEFAEEVIEAGLKLVPYVVLPHVDNAEFVDAVNDVRELQQATGHLIELTDSQAAVFDGEEFEVIDAAAN